LQAKVQVKVQTATRLSAAALLCGALLSAGCSQRDSADAGNAGDKVFRYSLTSAPTSLDPARATTLYANTLVQTIFDTLYEYKYLQRPYELKPSLAVALPEVSADGLSYTFRIRPGVRFADSPVFSDGRGREIIAADLVYALKRHFDPVTRSGGAWLWQGRIVGLDEWKAAGSDYDQPVEGLQAIDRYTLKILLTRPYPQLVYTLAMGFSAAVPREAIEYYGREFSVNPVGSGPFRLVSYNSAKAVLVPNANYRRVAVDLRAEGFDPATQGGYGLELIDGRVPPFVDRLEVDFISEGSARWSSFTKGNEVQMAGLPSEQIYRVLDSTEPVTLKSEYARKYHMKTAQEAGFVFTVFNFDFPEIGYNKDPVRNGRNRALRCAIGKAVNWQARNESRYGGLAEIFPGIILPVVPEFDPALSRESVRHDPQGARALLAENGWNEANLPELVYGSLPGPVSRLFFEQFRGWLSEIGYPQEKIISRTYATFGDMTKAWRNSELPIIAKAWLLDYPDAENTLQLFYGPNGSPGSNDGNYSNPAFDRMYQQSSVMQPSPARTALYREMNRLVVDDCAASSGLSRVGIGLWHRNIVAYPDNNFVGGSFLKYVDVLDHDIPAEGR
jgi:oligopeptide transport system substrate-binding protein